MEAEHKVWKETLKTDKEIGGDKAAEAAELSKRVLEKFGGPDLINALELTNLGNYPELIRCFSRIGRAMDSDKLILGNEAVSSPKSREELYYGKTNKE
jgi:hypothetical protein